MDVIEIRNVDELNYCICEYILRNRLDNVFIHCKSSKIIDSLIIYMTEVGIPCDVDNEYCGISISKQNDEETKHLCISSNITGNDPIEGYHLVNFVLRDIEKEQINSLVTEPEVFDLDAVPVHLKNEEIRKMFIKTFMIAESEIDIISPWMNYSVVNAALINLMKQALQRGVRIRIVYGLLPGSDEYNQMRSERSDQVAARLKETFGEFGDRFKITRDNIHYKLVLCDEKYKLEGGYNYLSFSGDYSDPDTRREGSPFGRDINEIRYLRKEYFNDGQVE